MRPAKQELSGWTMRPKAQCAVFRPERQKEVAEVLEAAKEGSLIARGCGASFADAALNDGQFVMDGTRLGKILAFDPKRGLMTCQGGTTLADVLSVAVPAGWFVAVTPGTAHVTVAGCFACDAHGKNHISHGSFAKNVTEIRILTGRGTIEVCTPKKNAKLFWATAGGMGLTGVVLDITIRLIAIESAYMNVRFYKTKNFEETFRVQTEHQKAAYSVTWFDPVASGSAMGRGVVMVSDHAELSELSGAAAEKPLEWRRIREFRLPWFPKGGVMYPPVVKAFNSIYYASKTSGGEPQLHHAGPCFYPMDRLLNWNVLFGRKRGFLEYQIVIGGDQAFDVCRHIVERLGGNGDASILAVLKRFGAEGSGYLSFPKEGYALSIEFPLRDDAIFKTLREFDHIVAKAGGRLYLAKDSCMDKDLVDEMYPRRKEWAEIANRYDPDHMICSSLNRRLGLRG
jgi:decaprenylphospho-beta-D-ribofuranose 2-oxidase